MSMRKVVAVMTAAAMLMVVVGNDLLRSRDADAAIDRLPAPTRSLRPSDAYDLPLLKGITFDPQHPLDLQFIIDGGDRGVSKRDVAVLAGYFLAGVTMPGEDLWVNLSPYESDRVIDDRLAQTDLGKDMLAQDYVLKQFASSLTDPRVPSGKGFWREALEKAASELGTTDVPVNTFNKVWIVPASTEIAEKGTCAVIADARLGVMLDQDRSASKEANAASDLTDGTVTEVNAITEEIVRAKLLPIIEKEVNSGRHFARIRQMYHALVLATWFRQKMYRTFYRHYMNKALSQGIAIDEKYAKEKVFALYAEAFKKGVYDFMAKEKDAVTGKPVGRHYFSGGEAFMLKGVGSAIRMTDAVSSALGRIPKAILAKIRLVPQEKSAPKGAGDVAAADVTLDWRESLAQAERQLADTDRLTEDEMARLSDDFESWLRTITAGRSYREQSEALEKVFSFALRYEDAAGAPLFYDALEKFFSGGGSSRMTSHSEWMGLYDRLEHRQAPGDVRTLRVGDGVLEERALVELRSEELSPDFEAHLRLLEKMSKKPTISEGERDALAAEITAAIVLYFSQRYSRERGRFIDKLFALATAFADEHGEPLFSSVIIDTIERHSSGQFLSSLIDEYHRVSVALKQQEGRTVVKASDPRVVAVPDGFDEMRPRLDRALAKVVASKDAGMVPIEAAAAALSSAQAIAEMTTEEIAAQHDLVAAAYTYLFEHGLSAMFSDMLRGTKYDGYYVRARSPVLGVGGEFVTVATEGLRGDKGLKVGLIDNNNLAKEVRRLSETAFAGHYLSFDLVETKEGAVVMQEVLSGVMSDAQHVFNALQHGEDPSAAIRILDSVVGLLEEALRERYVLGDIGGWDNFVFRERAGKVDFSLVDLGMFRHVDDVSPKVREAYADDLRRSLHKVVAKLKAADADEDTVAALEGRIAKYELAYAAMIETSSAVGAPDQLGGIDLKDIKVSAVPISDDLAFAPFDVEGFAGFSCEILKTKRATKADLTALLA
jgi:hypothetical protein